MTIQKGFWKTAGFSGALGTLAKGAALLYGTATGNIIDADQVADAVEQATTLMVGFATLAGSTITIYQGAKSLFARVKDIFAKKSAGLPWLKDNQPPQKE